MIKKLLMVACITLIGIGGAEARKVRVVQPSQQVNSCNSWDLSCSGMASSYVLPTTTTANSPSRNTRAEAKVIGGRPPGCPHRFCGCGASIYLFGKIIPHLNLAANWFKFRRTAPAPRMVAVRRGHVFVLLEPRGGSNWLAHDSNSGGGRTRIHVRSIAGYTIVDPNA